eukprot:TRINITY_DN5022_c0_g1_i1.p1 TRINITY_DN5022_c0_g1~~TRINITY_DN5022_c0_g1_i1.p1  ORF type:complete len:338 (+),score=87.67 TRINITY_DN5022_c0_g1_i1:61-1014(+)
MDNNNNENVKNNQNNLNIQMPRTPGSIVNKDSERERKSTDPGNNPSGSDKGNFNDITATRTYDPSFWNKGNISNLSFLIMLIWGILIRRFSNIDTSIKDWRYYSQEIFFAFGLFGFSGGVTNWLAIKMLFDKVPFLYGSGVIPNKFKEIKEGFSSMLMGTFFDSKFLRTYLHQKIGEIISSIDYENFFRNLLDSNEINSLIDEQIQIFFETRSEAVYLQMMQITPDQLKTAIKPFAIGLAVDLAPQAKNLFNPTKLISFGKLQKEIENLINAKLQEMTPEMVKAMIEDIIRNHLGWLIVWGNIFGGIIGIASFFAGY